MANTYNEVFADPAGNKPVIEFTSQDFQAKADKLEENLRLALIEVKKDSSNAGALAEYQSTLSEYTLYRSAQSNTTKSLKDIASGTISNFR